jgi:flavin reductase (DIM6/NTAB) family NADH-FMN oxidoreductase RutF
MRRVLVVLALVPSVVLAGCGSQTGASDDPGSAEAGATPSGATARAWDDCTPDAFDAAGAPLATLRHDGWQADMQLKLPQDGPCAGALVASGPAGVVGVDAASAELDGSTVSVLNAGDLGDSVLVRVDGGVHPRGGYQPHLYLVGPDALREVTVDGHPVVPFVATDGGMAPLAVRCGDGTIEVVSATTAEPPGVMMAWDVQRTTYTLSADGAREKGSGSLEEDVADPLLRKHMPELFDPGRLFAGC